jgi:tRNA 2-thiouridine synthesizing protein A
MSVTILDLKGLNCPLPVLRTKKALATDPGAVKDFEALCTAVGAKLATVVEQDGVYVFDIQKSA